MLEARRRVRGIYACDIYMGGGSLWFCYVVFIQELSFVVFHNHAADTTPKEAELSQSNTHNRNVYFKK